MLHNIHIFAPFDSFDIVWDTISQFIPTDTDRGCRVLVYERSSKRHLNGVRLFWVSCAFVIYQQHILKYAFVYRFEHEAVKVTRSQTWEDKMRVDTSRLADIFSFGELIDGHHVVGKYLIPFSIHKSFPLHINSGVCILFDLGWRNGVTQHFYRLTEPR